MVAARTGVSRLRTAMLTYFLLLAVCLVGWGYSFHADPDARGFYRLDIWLTAAFSAVTLVMAVASRRSLAPLFTARVAPKWWAAACILPFLTFATALGGTTLVSLLLNLPPHGPSYLQEAGVSLWIELLLVAVQPAVFEEIAFRGVVLDGLRESLDTREAVIVSAALFTLLHLQFFSVAHLMAIGLTLGYLRVRTGSLLPGMLVHFGHNALCVAFDRTIGAWP